jgi:hypothetical protein
MLFLNANPLFHLGFRVPIGFGNPSPIYPQLDRLASA